MPDTTLPAIGLGAVFTVFFVMLGPLKVLGPFVQLTHDKPAREFRKIAFLAFLLAVSAVVGGGLLGRILVEKWHVSSATLELAGGIIFALVGLQLVLQQYAPSTAAPAPLPAAPFAAALRITFPTIVTPHGIAAVIVLLVNSPDARRSAGVMAILLAVIVLDLLAMMFARSIMRGVVIVILQVLGAVLGVLQVALALQVILHSLRALGVLAPAAA